MRQLFIAFICFLWILSPAMAQEEAVYRITDVPVDVSAESAAAARDQAIIQAQRAAFVELLSRLGTEDRNPPTTDETIASLVQSFEVQKEHALGVRYTGTIAIQFRPSSVKELMDLWGKNVVDTRSPPLLVLPVMASKDHDTLWEENTLWRAAWAGATKSAGLVSLIVPEGDMEDITHISTREAVEGKADPLMALMQKYGASQACVAVLRYDPDHPDQTEVRLARYSSGGVAQEAPSTWRVGGAGLTEEGLMQAAVKQSVKALEQGWRQSQKLPSGAPVFLPVDVAVPTLASWQQVQRSMGEIPLITKAHVVTMTRGLVHIELEFRGDLATLQQALAEKGLSLEQTTVGGWLMKERVL